MEGTTVLSAAVRVVDRPLTTSCFYSLSIVPFGLPGSVGGVGGKVKKKSQVYSTCSSVRSHHRIFIRDYQPIFFMYLKGLVRRLIIVQIHLFS